MDNYRFNVTCEGEERFRRALSLALEFQGSRVTHYAITPKGLGFFWHEPGVGIPAQSLPFPMDRTALVDFAANWLKTAPYGERPDIDGDSGRGWTIYNESWGHVWGSFYGVIAIKPTWALYGK